MSFLTVKSLGKRYGAATALAGIDLAVARGSRTAIVGPSGSGKTTLLRLLAGFDAPDTGSIALDGETLADATGSIPSHRRGIGVVMQDGALFPHLTIAENIGFGLARARDRAAQVAALLDLVGLDRAMLARKPDELSGGQQQRVALARALAIKPRLMLLDEPFSALDTGLRAATRKAVAEVLGAAGVTAILVTHDQAEALSFADQVAILRGGRLAQTGTPQDLYFRPADPGIAEFLGDALVLPATISRGTARCSLGIAAVEDDGFEGTARILLRPEQIRLVEPEAAPDAPLALIESIEFSGSWSTITMRLLDTTRGAPPDAASLTLRRSGDGALQPGSHIRVVASGRAHRFRES